MMEEDPEFPDLYKVPPVHSGLEEMFNKARATSLRPHRRFYCAIDHLSGTMLPRGRLYSLAAPEQKAMQKYICEAWMAGLIGPSSSPAGGRFFLEEKRMEVAVSAFLGFTLSAGNIKNDPEKVEAVKAWLTPENCKQLQRFFWFCPLIYKSH